MENADTTLETAKEIISQNDTITERTLLKYRRCMADFMSYRDKKRYKASHPFPNSDLLQVTPKEIASWMSSKASGGEENPGAKSNIRATSLC